MKGGSDVKKKQKQKQEADKRNILLFVFSFIFLAISFIFFGLAFYFETDKIYYFFVILFFTIFIILYCISSKQITCDDGYNLLQAYFFFKKCQKEAGLSEVILKRNEESIHELASKSEAFKDFDRKKSVRLYETGYYVSTILKKKK